MFLAIVQQKENVLGKKMVLCEKLIMNSNNKQLYFLLL